MRTVLLTGATGFVGSAVAPALAAAGWTVRADSRRLTPDADWSDALRGAAAVVHLAARAHRLADGPAQAGEYRRVNAEATETLGRAAAAAGCRFVFLSSVKAVGEATPPGRPWNEDAPCVPEDAYGSSKLDAERRLAAVAGLSWCALRPPLVYGPGVKANFLRLVTAVDRGVPLPLATVDNRRSLLFVGNLASAVVRALEVPKAVGPFFIRDGEDLSTPELLRRMAAALGRPSRVFPFPLPLLRAGASLLGRGPEADRLLGDLAVDDARLRAALDWTPPFTVDQGLAAVARWYREGAG
ncbi:MAG: NAD-dependent epimerase/dehydratase family protein [Elusimicrobiota bacterium]|nr:NAD-dependent epimerase/dehydratase family protein [Elusimicrobiota bacterium]